MKNLFQLLIGFLTISLVVSCSKDSVEAFNQDNLEVVIAKSESDFVIETDVTLGNDAAARRGAFSGTSSPDPNTANLPACAVITVLAGGPSGGTFVFPFKVEIDFGTGCTNANGITRKGKLTIEFSNYLMAPGSVMTIVRGDNYYINLRKVEGTIAYTNTTTSAATPSWTRVVTNGKVTRPNGQVFTHAGSRSVVMAAGAGTPTMGDNVYHVIAGTHSVTRPNGITMNATIQEMLVKRYSCAHIEQGKINLVGGLVNGVLDYGDGTCDNQATYTHVNGTVYNINL